MATPYVFVIASYGYIHDAIAQTSSYSYGLHTHYRNLLKGLHGYIISTYIAIVMIV